MKPDIKQLKNWIAALDSGEYKQSAYRLQSESGYCCLGVACKVLIPDDKIIKCNGLISGTTPHHHYLYSPKWLNEINKDFANKTGGYLTDLNDSMEYTFPEIATLLELVYIHKMLD